MSEAPKGEISASKVIAFIGMLFTIALGIAYFYAVTPLTPLYVLWGIICLLIAFLLFITLGLISFGPLSKIPYQWWMLLIFGAVLILIAYFFNLFVALFYFPTIYFPGILILMAAFIELLVEKKTYKASKMVAIVGCCFAAYECVVLFLTGGVINIINGIFGLALIIILLLVIFDLVDFKIFDYSWWFVLLVGFVLFTWITPGTAYGGAIGGLLVLIAFVLVVMAY
ncbi:MAG: hypothetical protein ACFFDX_08950 [Candidatus Odinarchaeota archaeon]